MPLYIKDDTVDLLARRYQAVINAPSKTDAVRHALQSAIDSKTVKVPLSEVAAGYCLMLKHKSVSANAQVVDKAFRDSLYE